MVQAVGGSSPLAHPSKGLLLQAFCVSWRGAEGRRVPESQALFEKECLKMGRVPGSVALLETTQEVCLPRASLTFGATENSRTLHEVTFPKPYRCAIKSGTLSRTTSNPDCYR